MKLNAPAPTTRVGIPRAPVRAAGTVDPVSVRRDAGSSSADTDSSHMHT